MFDIDMEQDIMAFQLLVTVILFFILVATSIVCFDTFAEYNYAFD